MRLSTLATIAPALLAVLAGCYSRPRGPSVIVQPPPSPPSVVVAAVDPALPADARLAGLDALEPLLRTTHTFQGPGIASDPLALEADECVVVAAASDAADLAVIVRDASRPVHELGVTRGDVRFARTSAVHFCAPYAGGYVARVHARAAGDVIVSVHRSGRAIELGALTREPAPPPPLEARLRSYQLELEARGYEPASELTELDIVGRAQHQVTLEAGACYVALAVTEDAPDIDLSIDGSGSWRQSDTDPRADRVHFCTRPSDPSVRVGLELDRSETRGRVVVAFHRWIGRVGTHAGVDGAIALRLGETNALLELEGYAPFMLRTRREAASAIELEPGYCYRALPFFATTPTRRFPFDAWNFRRAPRAGWPGEPLCPNERIAFVPEPPRHAEVSHYQIYRRAAGEAPPVIVHVPRPRAGAAGTWLAELLGLSGYASALVPPEWEQSLARVEADLATRGRAEVSLHLAAGTCYALAGDADASFQAQIQIGGRVTRLARPSLSFEYCAERDGVYRLAISMERSGAGHIRMLARAGRAAACEPMPPMGPHRLERDVPAWFGRDAPLRDQLARAEALITRACVGRYGQSVLSSYAHYTRWADPSRGPAQPVGPVAGVQPLRGDGADCERAVAAARGQLPALYELELDAQRYGAALRVLSVILTEADRYYSRGHHDDDAMARGQELHGPLMEAYGVLACLQDRLLRGTRLLGAAALRDEVARARERGQRGRPELLYEAALAASDALVEASWMEISRGRLHAPNLPAYEQRVRELEVAVNSLGAHETAAGQPHTGAYQAAEYALRAALDITRRVRTRRPFTAEELRTPRARAHPIEGSIEALSKARDELVSMVNDELR